MILKHVHIFGLIEFLIDRWSQSTSIETFSNFKTLGSRLSVFLYFFHSIICLCCFIKLTILNCWWPSLHSFKHVFASPFVKVWSGDTFFIVCNWGNYAIPLIWEFVETLSFRFYPLLVGIRARFVVSSLELDNFSCHCDFSGFGHLS